MNAAMRLCVLCAASCLSTSVSAASFDCHKAASNIEKLICADKDLSRLDEKLAAAYHNALLSSGNDPAIQADQRRWLATVRNRCVDNHDLCLTVAYETRFSTLQIVRLSKATKWLKYQNRELGFSLSYPQEMAVHVGNDAKPAMFIMQFHPDARIGFSRSSIDGLLLSEAAIYVFRDDPSFCIDQTNDKYEIINGVRFNVSENSEGAGGHSYSGIGFATRRNEKCFLMLAVTESHYHDEQHEIQIKSFVGDEKLSQKRTDIKKALMQIVRSLKFLD